MIRGHSRFGDRVEHASRDRVQRAEVIGGTSPGELEQQRQRDIERIQPRVLEEIQVRPLVVAQPRLDPELDLAADGRLGCALGHADERGQLIGCRERVGERLAVADDDALLPGCRGDRRGRVQPP